MHFVLTSKSTQTYFVRKVWPKIGVQAIYRYEAKPGIRAQVDWAECGYIHIDGAKGNTTVSPCFLVIRK